MPTPTTEIERLRRLEREATPGPWVFDKKGPEFFITHGLKIEADPQRLADDAFVVAARNALPSLLDEIEELRNDVRDALFVPRSMNDDDEEWERFIQKRYAARDRLLAYMAAIDGAKP